MARIVVVQPVLTSYRKTFFEGVVTRLAEAGHTCVVVTGKERGTRRHAVTATWHRERSSRSFRISSAVVRYFGSLSDLRRADLAVVPLSTLWVDSYAALIMRRVGLGPKAVIVWGHIDSHSGTHYGIRERLVDAQLKFSDFVFSYTERGRASAIVRGIDESRVSSLNNTVDLKSLAQAVEADASDSSQSLLGRLGLNKQKTFSYIGGLDGAKRIDFLADVLDELWVRDRDVRLLVGGTGAQADLLQPGVDRGQVIRLGNVDEKAKAEMAAVSSAILMPGRVGLVAAESFVLGLPIITTENPFHAPEFYYLTPGVDCVVTANSVKAYAQSVERLMANPEKLVCLARAARSKSGWPSLEHMMDVFVQGCLRSVPAR